MSTALAERNSYGVIERVIALGDLKHLTPEDRADYYRRTCESVGLNPFTKPFEYLELKGKLTLYATKACTDQLRELHKISIDRIDRETSDGIHTVTAYASDATGRKDTDIGSVSIAGLSGEGLANAKMKSVTKAKRRVTLSICGLGMIDESEVEAIGDARRVQVDHSTGEIVNGNQPEQQAANGRRRDHAEEPPTEPTLPPDPFPAWKAKCIACPPERADTAHEAINKSAFTPAQKAELRGIIDAKRPVPEAPPTDGTLFTPAQKAELRGIIDAPTKAEGAYRLILAEITESGPSEPMQWVDKWVATRGIDPVTQDQHYSFASHIIREWFKWSISQSQNIQQHQAVCEKLTAGVRQLVLAADGEEMDRVSNERGLALKKRKP